VPSRCGNCCIQPCVGATLSEGLSSLSFVGRCVVFQCPLLEAPLLCSLHEDFSEAVHGILQDQVPVASAARPWNQEEKRYSG
jgi:hypothetical protein